jgi:hypothetical protein
VIANRVTAVAVIAREPSASSDAEVRLDMVLHGQSAPPAVVARAREQARAGLRPWACQRCAHCSCARCGAPLATPVASTLLADDGTESYFAALPIGAPRCSDPACRAR